MRHRLRVLPLLVEIYRPKRPLSSVIVDVKVHPRGGVFECQF